MSEPRISLYTDEDVDPRLAQQLLLHGYDVLSCRAAGNSNRALPDAWQLTYASERGRAILVFNIADYMRLDNEWRAAGRTHCGIVLSSAERSLSELIRRVQRHLDMRTTIEQHNAVLWLP
jgi:hypothetical protein